MHQTGRWQYRIGFPVRWVKNFERFMKYFFGIVVLAVYVFIPTNIFASDSTKTKTVSFSVGVGLTSSSVYGSMVARNNQFDGQSTMQNKIGYTIRFNIEKQVGSMFFFNTGLHYTQKQVDPMVKSNSIYRDRLKTGYISIPLEIGVNLWPQQQHANLSLLLGAFSNFCIADKSTSGPDRVGFKASGITETLAAGARLSLYQSISSKFFVQYNYCQDITNTYIETLYWTSNEPNKKFVYKYRTHIISTGLLFTL
jgi:hypothetical protein